MVQAGLAKERSDSQSFSRDHGGARTTTLDGIEHLASNQMLSTMDAPLAGTRHP